MRNAFMIAALGAAVLGTGRSESGAGYLLGIKPEWRPLRAVAPDRQRARHGFRLELVAEPGLVGDGGDLLGGLLVGRLELRVLRHGIAPDVMPVRGVRRTS